MTIDSDEVRLAPFGNVYVADIGTTLPTTATMSLNASFEALGYVNEDGVTISPNVDLSDIMMWQSAVPVKTTLDTLSLEIQFSMGQVNLTTWGLYFFNGDFTNNFGQAALEISSNPGTQEKALIIEWEDDEEDQTRLVIPRAVLTDRESLKLVRKDAQLTGITFRALDNSGTLAYIYSENPDLAPST